jgi:hypothetical protein
VVATLDEVLENSLQAQLMSFSFTKKFNNEYIIENRHHNQDIQQAYDRRFGLITI